MHPIFITFLFALVGRVPQSEPAGIVANQDSIKVEALNQPAMKSLMREAPANSP